MEEISVVGVARGNEYSPNHVGNDAAILNCTAEALRQKGCKVTLYPEKEFTEKRIKADFIFDMARDRATLTYLKELEQEGALVINSAHGIDNCVRRPMTELLLENGIPHPVSHIIPTTDEFTFTHFPYWIKRGDSHAMVKEDVVYVTNKEEAENVLADFRNRSIPVAVINEHLQGDLVKFYGVQDTDFFYWFHPSPCSHSKFGLEKINGLAHGYAFSLEDLKAHCDRAARVLNTPVYGGDCVVLPNGEMKIIDFNDWPSFARCREEAGVKIAEHIYDMILRKLGK